MDERNGSKNWKKMKKKNFNINLTDKEKPHYKIIIKKKNIQYISIKFMILFSYKDITVL